MLWQLAMMAAAPTNFLILILTATIFLTAACSTAAFVSPIAPPAIAHDVSLDAIANNNPFNGNNDDNAHAPTPKRMPPISRRRSFLQHLSTSIVVSGSGAAAIVAPLIPSVANAEAESMERGGVSLTPFNSLSFNYRGGSNPTVSNINEPSVSYSDFLTKLNSDQVSSVEFLAPNGDVAYATFKQSTSDGDSSSSSVSSTLEPIRIGEGYPLEDPEGWSSPAFVIKAVAKKGVPYKFVVPGVNTKAGWTTYNQ